MMFCTSYYGRASQGVRCHPCRSGLMIPSERQSHWQNVYQSKAEEQVSWTQFDPQPSLGLIEKFAQGNHASIVDIGGGASRLVDALLAHGFAAITVLDLS